MYKKITYLNKINLIFLTIYTLFPCKNEIKYDGYEIIGVSLDQDKDNWIKAIKKDELTW